MMIFMMMMMMMMKIMMMIMIMRYLLARGGYVKGDRYPGDQNCSILGSRVNSDVHGGVGKAWSISTVVKITKNHDLFIMTISTFCECAELCVSCKLLQKPYQALFVNIRWSLRWEGAIIFFSYFRYFETKMSFAAELGRISCHRIDFVQIYFKPWILLNIRGAFSKANLRCAL